MSNIHYFQRYDSKENWITNSTLLLLSRLYYYDRLKFEAVINSILLDSNLSLNVGPYFAQQQRENSSVVDGAITQDAFKLVIETKLYDNFSTDQLIRHLEAFTESASQNILLALSKNKVSDNVRAEIIKTLQLDQFQSIRFASTTYEEIFGTIASNLTPQDLEMRNILDDYISLCEEHGLINIENRTMLAVTCGESIEENLRFNIYYDPAMRSHNSPFRYIGLYHQKAIIAIGKVVRIVYCDYVDGELIPTFGDDLSDLTSDQYNRIKETIEQTDYYDLTSGNKFFLVDEFIRTNYVKESYYSIRAKKYFWLNELEGFREGMEASELAELLNGQTWE